MDIFLRVTLSGFKETSLEVTKDLSVLEVYEYLQEEFKLHNYSISKWTCFSQGLKKYLDLNENFKNNDQLIIKYDTSLKLKPKNFDFKEIQYVYSNDSTIKNIIDSVYSQLQIDKNDALINIYYGQTLLNEQQMIREIIQNDNNTFEIEKILTQYSGMNKNIPMCDSHLNYQISQICTCKHQCSQRKLCNICPYNNHKGINKEFFIPLQIFADQINNQFQISSELKSFKTKTVRQFEKLEQDLKALLQSLKTNIMNWLEWYEKDVTLFEELYKKLQISPLFDFTNEQLEQMIEIISEKKVEKIQEKIQNSLHIFENQIRSLEGKVSQELYYIKYKQIDEQSSQKVIQIRLESSTLILELLEYLQQQYPQDFSQYIKVFGPLNEWIGLQDIYGNIISVSQTLKKFKKNDRIKFGPIHIIISFSLSDTIMVDVELFNLKIDQSEIQVTSAALSNNYQFENFIGQQIPQK